MTVLLAAVRMTGYFVLVALAFAIGRGLLAGTIHTSGLLYRRGASGTPVFTPERALLLLATLAVAALYVSKLPTAIATARLPPVPDSWVAALGGSHALYLVAKSSRRSKATSPTPR